MLIRVSSWWLYCLGVYPCVHKCSGRRHPRTRLPYGEDADDQVKPAILQAGDQSHDASSSTIGLPGSATTGVAVETETDPPQAGIDLSDGVSHSPADAPAESTGYGGEHVSSPASNVTEPGAIPVQVPPLTPTRAYDARFASSAVCVCAEERLVHDAVQQLVGAVRETAAVLTLLHSKDPVARQCALLGRLFEFDGFLW